MEELYHASKEIVKYPEIRKAKYTKDICITKIQIISNGRIEREICWINQLRFRVTKGVRKN